MKALLREVRILFRESSCIVSLILGLIAISVATTLPVREIRARLKADASAQTEAQGKLEKTIAQTHASEGSFKEPMDFEIPFPADTREKLYNFQAVLPPSPLAVVVSPLPDDRAEKLSVYDHNDEHPSLLTGKGRLVSNTTAISSPVNLLRSFVGNMDLLFVVAVVLPLLIIGAASDLTASDVESRVLSLLIAQGASLWRLLVLRCVARIIVVLLPWLIWLAGSIGIATQASGLSIPWGRTEWWVVIAALYLLFWFCLCVAANAALRLQLSSALSLLGTWAAFVVLVPMATGLSLRTWKPAVSSLLLADKEKSDREAANETMSAAYTATMQSFHEATGIDPFKVTPSDRPRYLMSLRTERFPVPQGNAVLDCYFSSYPTPDGKAMHYQQYYAAQIGRDCNVLSRYREDMQRAEEALEAQRRTANKLRWLSPTLLTKDALAVAAGADDLRYDNFLDQFDQYLRQREEFFGMHLRAYTPIFSRELSTYRLFRFVEPRLSIITVLPAVFGLTMANLLVAFIAWRFSMRKEGFRG